MVTQHLFCIDQAAPPGCVPPLSAGIRQRHFTPPQPPLLAFHRSSKYISEGMGVQIRMHITVTRCCAYIWGGWWRQSVGAHHGHLPSPQPDSHFLPPELIFPTLTPLPQCLRPHLSDHLTSNRIFSSICEIPVSPPASPAPPLLPPPPTISPLIHYTSFFISLLLLLLILSSVCVRAHARSWMCVRVCAGTHVCACIVAGAQLSELSITFARR